VTLCVEERRCLFGSVLNGVMTRNPLGEAVHSVWGGLSEHYPWVQMDQFVLMPNHLHGIVFLTGDETGERPRDAIDLIELVRRFKTFTTREHRRGVAAGHWPPLIPGRWPESARLWQRGYHDRVIRDDRELAAIRAYIVNNEMQWLLDRENPESSASLDRGKWV
jgi:REP element-mobilizing transposase RayT